MDTTITSEQRTEYWNFCARYRLPLRWAWVENSMERIPLLPWEDAA